MDCSKALKVVIIERKLTVSPNCNNIATLVEYGSFEICLLATFEEREQVFKREGSQWYGGITEGNHKP